MSQLVLRRIRSEVTKLNVAKEGWTTYYVDDTDGVDTNDGLTWISAKKTIQATIDAAESWAKIYVKSGIYAENVLIDGKDGIHMIGEDKSTTIITVTAGDALRSENNINFTLENFNLVASAAGRNGLELKYSKFARISKCDLSDGLYINIDSHYTLVENIVVDGNDESGLELRSSDHCVVRNSEFKNNAASGIYILRCSNLLIDSCDIHDNDEEGIEYRADTVISSYDNEIMNCDIYGHSNVGMENIYMRYVTRLKLHDNNFSIKGVSYRNVEILATATHCQIYHNNFIDGTYTNVEDAGSDNDWFENHYSEHTTDTNNDGLCDTAYTFTTGTDHSPVSKRYGWNQTSVGVSEVPDIYDITQKWEGEFTGTLNDANTTDTIIPTKSGLLFLDIELDTIINGDDFTIKVEKSLDDGVSWLPVAEDRLVDAQVILNYSIENVKVSSTIQVKITVTKNSATDRDFFYKGEIIGGGA